MIKETFKRWKYSVATALLAAGTYALFIEKLNETNFLILAGACMAALGMDVLKKK